jgi:hypothetical protein
MSFQIPSQLVRRADGVTETERYLKRLCEKTFLSMWSYPGVFRDQGKTNGGDGKEVCDLLVVFEKEIIIFSDKSCTFPDSGDLEVDWSRWFRRAILASATQAWGAERWISRYPNRLFLDRGCTQQFPLKLPDLATATFHHVLVAHNAADRCRKADGGSGSLRIDSHFRTIPNNTGLGSKPFVIGPLDRARAFVHILDEVALDIVLGKLDTVSDFTSYLRKKEALLLGARRVMADGEEDLLAVYLQQMNGESEHDFVFPDSMDPIVIPSGEWQRFASSQVRLAQRKADEISRGWDWTIQNVAANILGATSYFSSHPEIERRQMPIRFMAREGRVRRRLLSESLMGLMRPLRPDEVAARVVLPSNSNDPYYVFLLVPHNPNLSESDYRIFRRTLLQVYCRVTKLDFPDALDVVGLAMEPFDVERSSQDTAYFDFRQWTPAAQENALELKQKFPVLRAPTLWSGTVYEYPS